MRLETFRAKCLTLVFCLCVCLGARLKVDAQITGGPPQTSLPTAADGGNLGSGKLNFQPDLFTGRFTYTVPIVVPPGRQNSQPKLSLNYNSSVGNGWCGVGWKLELGKIERETRYGIPLLWTPNGQPVQYDDSKSFTVDFGGVEGHLVRVSAGGQNPAEYRLQTDKTFLKFLYYTNVANAYWDVIDKSGMQYFFGEAASNRLDNPNFASGNGYGTNTFRWALDRVVDANGNLTLITYTNQNISNLVYQLYPVQLSYNGNANSPALAVTNTVQFILTNRPDSSVNCMAGFQAGNSSLLSQVIVQAAGQKVRRYVLGYAQSPSTLRTLLTSVTEYGADDTSSLPPVTFNYQVQQMGFGPMQPWSISSEGQSGADWNGIAASDSSGNVYVKFVDIDGDGLPDRVMRTTNSTHNAFVVQRNTGTNFTGNYTWGGLSSTYNGNITSLSGSTTKADFFDINGDGRPDYVMANNSTSWLVQTNTGAPGAGSFATAITWTNLASGYPDIHNETVTSGYAQATEEMDDINGDGLLDRIYRINSANEQVQLNTGSGFGPTHFVDLLPSFYISAVNNYSSDSEALEVLADINGDGLPDSVSDDNNSTVAVSYNIGISPSYNVLWTPILVGDWGSSIYPDVNLTANAVKAVQLIDINGDGLPDRVMARASAGYTNFQVQINTGSEFSSTLYSWTNVQSQAGSGSEAWDSLGCVNSSGVTTVALVDINGDGLPDRVMTAQNSPYTNFWVQLNLGPFPDLLCGVSNGIGGSVTITYLPSTKYDNTDRTWTNDPWAEGAKSLLPFPVYTVSTIAVNDGMGDVSTNTYAYKHGFFDPVSREFRGFNNVAVTDPYGAKTVTYFHQSGGFNDTADGEFQDPGTVSKKGMPYRVETWGTNGLLYQLVLNKVQEYVLNTNGWYFPCVTQTMVLSYEGLSSYRATAVQYSYDTNTENLAAEADYGEVGSVVVNGQTFTDIGNDSLFKWVAYASIGNIRNRPSDTKVTADAAGTIRLQEATNSYDGNGNLLVSQSWLNTAGGFIGTVTNTYDQYGNVKTTTDASGITTTFTYDSAYAQFPVSATTATFTSSALFDNRSGAAVSSTDIKGLVSSNSYDVFFRPTASYISTNAYGPASLWQTRTFYTLGGISGGNSYNIVHSQVNDGLGTTNGHDTYTFADGLGRTIETRDLAETGQFRVANTVYDLHGKPSFATLPYFSSSTNYTAPSGTYLGSLTEYDMIGRPWRSTPAENGSFTSGTFTGSTATGGDTGSPVGAATNLYVDGSNPWATVVTDALGKTKKSYRDAYGRTIQVTDVSSTGNVNTMYIYDAVGNLTNVTDNTGTNIIVMGYDSLGRKILMVDPDMGTWSYVYDNAGRMTQQTDARTNTIKFFYNDPLGRLNSKRIYNLTGTLVGTVTNIYDSSDDPNYTVYPGQLYKVVDLQGYQRSSYDVRGRVLKNGRYLNANTMEYVTQATYDDADHVQQLTYPGNAAIIKYSYDTVGHITQVKSLAGTGTQEIFYTPGTYNALDQLSSYTCGNGVATSYGYFANSKRLQNLTTAHSGTNIQNLSYTYDNVSDVASISDGVYPTGIQSASLSSITYDDLYRITSLSSTARGTKSYAYTPIGNVLTNQDNGSGLYQYGAKPHAVISANGVNYGYDACGNMTTRGNQTLAYDAQNQLASVTTTNDMVLFGYDDSGERLYRAGTNGYAVWIGGIYEINNGKVLCHVYAGGQLVATFEPQCGGLWSKAFGEEHWYAFSNTAQSVLSWPFENGRAHWTVFGGSWAAICGVCLMAGRRVPLKRYEIRRALRPVSLWRWAVTLTLISAFLAGSVGNADAGTYTGGPVFYYYHTDHLGSSNVLTDRSGNVVQHYEYATFGQTFYQNNTSAFPISNRYTGQIADDETGLYYYGGRYYDPQLGRFIQPDPTVPDPTDSQSLNRYSYCQNNPLNETDPTGFDDSFGGGGDFLDYGFSGNFGGSNFSTGSWWSSWATTYGGVSFAGFSGYQMGVGSYEANMIAYGGNWSVSGYGSQYVPGDTWDGVEMPGSYISGPFAFGNATPPPSVTPTANGGGGWSWSGFAEGVGIGLAGVAIGVALLPVIGAGIAAGGLIAAGTYAAVGAASLAGGVATGASIDEAVNGKAWSWNGDGRTLSDEERSAAAGQAVVGLFTLGLAAGKDTETIRIRHYTNNKGLNGISETGIIRASDQNRVFAESASRNALSQVEAEDTYGLKPGRGRNYLETDVAKSQVSQRVNPKTGATELVIKGNLKLQNPTFTKRP